MTDKTSAAGDDAPYCADPDLQSIGTAKFTAKMLRRHGERYLAYRKRWAAAESGQEQPFPVNLEFDLIDACTLKCPQCLRDPELIGEYAAYLGKGSRLTLEDVRRLMDEGRAHGLPSVNIGGSGEPMLHPDFAVICGEIMRRDVLELRVISNGTLLTEQTARALIDHQVHFLSLSIDAATAATYGAVRGQARLFDKVVDNVLRFLALREAAGAEFPMLRVTFVRQRANLAETDAFVDFWRDKADLIDIQAHMDYRSQALHHDIVCWDPWKRLLVYADGHVAPCCGFPGIVLDMGDCRRTSLAEIWRGEPIARLRRSLSEGRFPAACLKCRGSRVTFGTKG
ncbi:radical SAM/SPASM domain-containing protein [Solidesulfovibrio sp.]|uniref:radical SAM/SPASM domain-containing protein n=1 Tax=Solidesulfovibrio sp. TaxID=2910990 RepID=UPI002B21D2C0|nr:radical SAM protein [Solidesulfovibrio sp.]MEA5090920.1 radical SAM protein [Solidesulfovibrio sp.]